MEKEKSTINCGACGIVEAQVGRTREGHLVEHCPKHFEVQRVLEYSRSN